VEDQVTMSEEMRNFMSESGYATTTDLVPDNKVHRFMLEGDKKAAPSGTYKLKIEGNFAVGWFRSHKDGVTHGWHSKKAAGPVDRTWIAESRRDEAAERLAAAKKAASIWAASGVAGAHTYLTRKGVAAYGLRAYKGALVVPVRNSLRQLCSLQFIDAEGKKRFLKDGQKQGCYHAIGPMPDDLIYIAEGYATGASIHAATGAPVAIAFDAGNLMSVGVALRKVFPDIKIIFASDADNVGVVKATAAAAAVKGEIRVAVVALPLTDFNDVRDLVEIRRQLI